MFFFLVVMMDYIDSVQMNKIKTQLLNQIRCVLIARFELAKNKNHKDKFYNNINDFVIRIFREIVTIDLDLNFYKRIDLYLNERYFSFPRELFLKPLTKQQITEFKKQETRYFNDQKKQKETIKKEKAKLKLINEKIRLEKRKRLYKKLKEEFDVPENEQPVNKTEFDML